MNLSQLNKVYFIGIGGVGMSALARYFFAIGKQIMGYDKNNSPLVKELIASGISIHFSDEISQIQSDFLDSKTTLVIYTPAVPNDHKQLNYFRTHKYQVVKRSEALGLITKKMYSLAVAGTHGKTTTSTILGHILHEAGVKATSFLGGIAENYNSNLILDGQEVAVVEADEYDRSFLQLSPNIACITSMDADHLDIYDKKEALEDSFNEFAQLVSETLVVHKSLSIKGTTYAVEEKADYYADNLLVENGTYIFDVKTPKEIITNIKFNLPGKHNVLNAVAALAMANIYGIPLLDIAQALRSFKGVQRRFSYRIKSDDLVLIDDYAHHPKEICAVASTIREMYPQKEVLVIFQPHLFSRTRDFADEFARSLEMFDALVLLDIYPAREVPIPKVTSKWLLDKINLVDKKLSNKKELLENIRKDKRDVIVMLGAGDIGELVKQVQNVFEDEN